jgi:hypothetical protein
MLAKYAVLGASQRVINMNHTLFSRVNLAIFYCQEDHTDLTYGCSLEYLFNLPDERLHAISILLLLYYC